MVLVIIGLLLSLSSHCAFIDEHVIQIGKQSLFYTISKYGTQKVKSLVVIEKVTLGTFWI